MIKIGNKSFHSIVVADFEFLAKNGEIPCPICMVAKDLVTGQKWSIWEDELAQLTRPPFDVGSESLFVAYYASAELGCFRALGWPPPCNVLDLYTEFRTHMNGKKPAHGFGLLGALAHFCLNPMGSQEKKEMRQLALRGGPWTPEEEAR